MGIRKKPNEKCIPKVTKELEGLNISINSLGNIQSSFDIDKINAFLDQHVSDPKIEEANRAAKKETE